MRPTKLLPVSLLPFLCLIYLSSTAPTTAGTSLASGPGGLPFNVTYLFTATLGLGQPPSEIKSNPITIFGGVRVPEPILNGTVSGPYLNGTITAGLAAPAVYNTGTLQVPTIDLYGVTADGDPLRIHETGIGSPSAQITRIVRPPPPPLLSFS